MDSMDSWREVTGDDVSVETRLLEVYAELLRVERHWTEQVQAQQRPIAAVLAVNGFLLALLIPALVDSPRALRSGWPIYPFLVATILLSIALGFGVLTLWPRIRITRRSDGAASRGQEKVDRVDEERRATWLSRHFFGQLPEHGDMPLWLDARDIWQRARLHHGMTAELLQDLCDSVAANAEGNLVLKRTLDRRRLLMNWQIGFLLLSLICMLVAMTGLASQFPGDAI
jgi:hypothetical protein